VGVREKSNFSRTVSLAFLRKQKDLQSSVSTIGLACPGGAFRASTKEMQCRKTRAPGRSQGEGSHYQKSSNEGRPNAAPALVPRHDERDLSRRKLRNVLRGKGGDLALGVVGTADKRHEMLFERTCSIKGRGQGTMILFCPRNKSSRQKGKISPWELHVSAKESHHKENTHSSATPPNGTLR